jgi:hypothetical protein
MRAYRWSFLAAAVIFAVPVFGHHGTAAYDTTKTVTVNGTIAEFEFINPHVMVFFEVKNEKGSVDKWQGELTSPNHLARYGWSKQTLKPGDPVTFSGLRAKSGATTLWITKIIAADGHEIPVSPVD